MGNDQIAEPRARVFISCGQSKGSDEVAIAAQISERLQKLGFEPYIAVQEQTLIGLTENIFEQLGRSEYFVFVDFKREGLCPSSGRSGLGRYLRWKVGSLSHRGSLFSHQELAIASYLKIPVLAFQEAGVKTDDGILRFLQANAIPFPNRYRLPDLVADEAQKRDWDPRSRNELFLERDAAQYSPTNLQGKSCRFFHVGVRNRNLRKTARDCYVYLEKVTRLEPNAAIPVKQVEFRWAGYDQPNAHVLPGRVRPFDAFFILDDLPTQLQFNVFATGTDFIPRIGVEGCYELEYSVVSENFPEARASFVLNLNTALGLTTLEAKTG
jgi:hypothetical protein